jgi:probable rRNA maturation factor
LSLLFCDDPVIQPLNRDYRGFDKPTDVLSFSQQDSVNGTLVPETPVLLGDVIISLETAARQAQAAGQSLRREIEWLTLHGVLHLLGHDDETEEGLQAMIARQEAALLEYDSGILRPSDNPQSKFANPK